MEPIEPAGDEFQMIRHHIALLFTCKLARKGSGPNETRTRDFRHASATRSIRIHPFTGGKYCKREF